MFKFLVRLTVFSLATYFVCRGVLLVSGTNTLGTAIGPVMIALSLVCGAFFAMVAPRQSEDKTIVERWDDPGSARIGTQFSAMSAEDRSRLYSGPERRVGPGLGSAARGKSAPATPTAPTVSPAKKTSAKLAEVV